MTCKIRCLPNEADTLVLAKKIEDAGASLLTVHGRTKEHNKQTVGPANYSIIKKIKETLSIPVIANGGVSTFEDVEHALKFTGCDGIMSSESILEYPALFDPSKIYDLDDLCLEYFDMYDKYPGEGNLKILRCHMHKFLHSGFTLHGHVDLRAKIGTVNTIPQLREIAEEMRNRRKGIPAIEKITWYYRHWEKGEISKAGLKNKGVLPKSYIDDATRNEWMAADPRNP